MSTNSFTHSLVVRRIVAASVVVGLLALTLLGLPAIARADTSYTVQSGDNLTKIARLNGTTVEALVAANKAKFPCLATNPACLQIGWVIAIPGAGGGPNVAASLPGTYVVQSGDSMAKIAKKLGVDFNALIAANKKDHPCLAAAQPCFLQIGWVLNVPGGAGSAPAPTATPTTAAASSPPAEAAATATPSTDVSGLAVVFCLDIEASVTIFHDGQIVKQSSLHRDTINFFPLPPGRYDAQFSATGYGNLNLAFEIGPGQIYGYTFGGC